jgi:hypothetical protein
MRITNNVLLNTNSLHLDGSAIYLQDANTTTTNILISNNFIRDYGTDTSSDQRRGIYLDDGLSNATISGNIIAGLGAYAFQYHGGHNDIITGNIIDLEYAPQTLVAYQWSTGTIPP